MWCGGYGMGWSGMGGMGMTGVGGWVGMILSSLVPLAIVGLLVYGALKVLSKRPSVSGSAALDILDTRYAKNEITQDEYKRMREQLSR